MIIFIVIFSILSIIISILIYQRINYFKNINVPHETLNILFGNTQKSTLGKCSVTYDTDRIYTKFKGRGLCAGFMNGFTPYLLPLNAEVLKQILITNFKNFRNSSFSLETERHSVISLNPFWLRNEKWKQKRSELSPALTSSRLKGMYPLIDDAAKQFSDYIRIKMASNTSMIFDVRDISLRYSCNSITSTTYAFDAQAYDEENTSEILNYGKRMWRSISTSTMLPSSPITREVNQYFIRIMNQAVQRRRYSNEKRNDLLNYVISLKDKRNFSELETAAHALVYWLDGFETSSLALTYVLYELSKNTRVQDKLRIEINENVDTNQTAVPIETLLNLTYLDQVFYEAIRLHPPLHYTTRVCNESIELISDEQKILIPIGTTIWIPIYSIHRDPDVYENPHEFMPERFDEENGGVKAFRDNCSLIPFGESARICLGKNLGTLQVKAAVVELLRNFELICDNSVTDDDLKIRPQQFTNIPKGDIKIQLKKLSDF